MLDADQLRMLKVHGDGTRSTHLSNSTIDELVDRVIASEEALKKEQSDGYKVWREQYNRAEAAEADRDRAVEERDEAKAGLGKGRGLCPDCARDMSVPLPDYCPGCGAQLVTTLKSAPPPSSFGHCTHGHSGVALIRWSPAPNEHVIACPQCLVVERDEWKRNAEMLRDAVQIQQRTESAASRLADAHRGEERELLSRHAEERLCTIDGETRVRRFGVTRYRIRRTR